MIASSERVLRPGGLVARAECSRIGFEFESIASRSLDALPLVARQFPL